MGKLSAGTYASFCQIVAGSHDSAAIQFGESQKLVSAVFSLAEKLQPCIVFIDEIDSFLRERKNQDHEVIAMMKAEFMTYV